MATSARVRPVAEISPGQVAFSVIVGVIVAGATVYFGLGHVTAPALPTLWEVVDGCKNCGVASNRHDVYRLIDDNETMFGNTNYTVLANNLSSGAAAWAPISVFVRQGFGFYQETFGEIAPFFADNDTLSLVVYGSGEWVTGQSQPFNLSGFGIMVLEWNATSGAFLGVQRSLTSGFQFTFVAAVQSDGWLVVDWVAGGEPTNVSIETFPEQAPGTQLSKWAQNVTIPPYHWEGWPLLPLTVGAGLVTLTVMEGNGTTVVLSSVGGTVEWSGQTPSFYAAEGFLSTVGYYNDVVRLGHSVYYLGENDSNLSIMRFDLSTYQFTAITGALPVVAGQFSSTELETDSSGDFVVTDAWNGTYYSYAADGALLWTSHIALSPSSVPSPGGISALAFQPIEISHRYLFTALFEDQSWMSGPTNSSYTFSFSAPLNLLNETTGNSSWQNSYSTSFIMGNPGPTTQPLQYLPVSAEGADLVYLYGSSLGVAQFANPP